MVSANIWSITLFWYFIFVFLLFFSLLLLYILRKSRKQLSNYKKSEQNFHKLSLLANRTSSYFIIADKDDKIEWVNEAFSRITGFQPNEVIGKKNAELMLSDYANRKIRNEIFHVVLKNHKKYNG